MEFLKSNLKEYLLDIMKTTPTSEKAAFIKERYWIWDDFQEKEWDNKTIRNVTAVTPIRFSCQENARSKTVLHMELRVPN